MVIVVLAYVFKFFDDFINSGVHLTDDVLLQKKIKLTNYLGFLVGCCTIPFIFVFYIFGSRTFGGATVVNTALFFSVAYFNKRGDFNFSRHLLLLTWGFGIFIYTLYLGVETGIQNCFFSLIAVPFILFTPNEKKKFYHVIFPFVAYFVIELKLLPDSDMLGISSYGCNLIRNFVNPVVLFQLIMILYYYGVHERGLIVEVAKAEGLSKNLLTQKKHLIAKSNQYESAKVELESLLASLDDVVLEVNEDADIINFWTQKNREELEIGRSVADYYGLFMQKKIEASFEAFGPDYFNKVHEYSCNDKHYQFKVTQLSHEGSKIEKAAVVIRDVTINKVVLEEYNEIKKEKQLALRSAKFKESFLANMSHEIRTPLNGVVGMIDMLQETKLDNIQKDYLQTIKSSSDNLLELINDILDLSKIEAGKMSLQPTRCNIHRVVESSVDLFKPLANSKGLAISLNIKESVPKFIQADPTRISQVLTNLISNAVKFTIEGEIRVEVDLKSDHQIRFQVIDTGEGIPEDSRKSLFKKFIQLNQKGKSKIKGTGLGLSIVKELVVLMKGAIRLESEINEGSNFTFYIHFDQVEQDESNQEDPHGNTYSEKIRSVLLVDDISVNRKVAGIMLKKLQCNVVEAVNGKEALKIIEDEEFDLILMDIQMPEMDGVEALAKLKAKYSNLPPIIALSANALEGDKEKYLEMGFDAYIPKPVTLMSLRDHLKKVS